MVKQRDSTALEATLLCRGSRGSRVISRGLIPLWASLASRVDRVSRFGRIIWAF